MSGMRWQAMVGVGALAAVLAGAAAPAEHQTVFLNVRWLSVGESGIERILMEHEFATLDGYSAMYLHGEVILFADRGGAPGTVSYVPAAVGIGGAAEAAAAIGVEQVVAGGERVTFYPTLAAEDSAWLEMHYETCDRVPAQDGAVIVAGTTTHSFHKLRWGTPHRIPIEHGRAAGPTRWLEVTVRTPDSRR